MESHSNTRLPLCVDLDETFCKVDTLWEVAMIALRHQPARLLRTCGAFFGHRNRSRFKAELSNFADFDASHLPIRLEVRDYLQDARSAGRMTLLITGADQAVADAVALAFPDFDEVRGSGNGINLKGRNKADYLVQRFGRGGYEYVGDCGADIPVWQSAGVARVIAIGGHIPSSLIRQVPELKALVVERRSGGWRVLRPHQWVKNLLLFVPLISAHRVGELGLVAATVTAFGATCLVASAVYILNDFLDVAEDRQHPDKRRRVIPSGDIHFSTALIFAGGCLLGAGILASQLSLGFGVFLSAYLTLALVYAFGVKRLPGFDLVLLTGLYVFRLLLGGSATGIECSGWLLGFALAFFGSLATLKRYAELRVWESRGIPGLPGRSYSLHARPYLLWVGGIAGVLAVALLPFYVRGEQARELYAHPDILLGLMPLILLGLAGIWKAAIGGKLLGDPVTYALSKPVNYAMGAAALALLWLAGH